MRFVNTCVVSVILGVIACVPARAQDEDAEFKAVKEISQQRQETAAAVAELAKADTPPERRAQLQTGLKAAEAKTEDLAKKFPESAPVRNAAAQQALQARDWARAAGHADKAVTAAELKQDKTLLADSLVTRGTTAWWAGDYPRAAADAKRALELKPDDKAARALYEFSKGRLGASSATAPDARDGARLAQLDSLLDQASPLSDPRVRAAGERATGRGDALGHAQEAMRRLAQLDGAGALAAADAAVRADPALADGYMQRGLSLAILKQFADAVRELTKAIELWTAQGDRANLPAAYGARAHASNELNDFPTALLDSEKAIALNGGFADGYRQRARAREGLGEKGRAVLADFERAAQLEPMFAADYEAALKRLGGPAPEAAAPAARRAWGKYLFGAAGLALILVGAAWGLAKRRPNEEVSFAGRRSLSAQYDLIEPIGEGGMGMVYKGWDKSLKRPVAIKKLRAELQRNPRERARFIKEAETVASLSHPHIVAIHAILTDDEETHLVFEFVAGRTVHDLLNESPGRHLTPGKALAILKAIAEAVDHAHGRHVIHRDLKPSNVMLADGDFVKVMDFGIARQVQDSLATSTNTIVGTPVYMAPEQAMGAVVRQSDVFALGVTFYEMLTGGLPFKGANEVNDKLEGRFLPPSQLLPGLNPAIDAVLAKALAPRAEDRYSRCQDLYQDALKALHDEAPTPR